MFSFPWFLSLLVGFLSLSEEILWVRVVGFGYVTLPPAFSFVLANYLVGIALGAALGKRLCNGKRDLYMVAAVVLIAAAALDVCIPPLVSAFIIPFNDHSTRLLAALIIATAALKSVLFPIVHHLGSTATGPAVGRSVSRIYFGNIIGATLGPILTGFVALEHLSADACFVIVGVACLVAAAACAVKVRGWALLGASAAAMAIALFLVLPIKSAGGGMLAALADLRGMRPITHFSANRHGVIHTLWGEHGDYVYGGNVYDGIASVNVDANPNRLDRLYMLALTHPQPRRVLVVGLSTGAWTRALQGFPGIERIDIVEINPAYIDLIHRYPEIAPLLDDPRVHVYIDDGRRWLKRNPAERYDLVVQNTTFFWRSNASNLLSREYFTQVRQHLAPGGVATINTTGSFDVLRTAADVFANAYRYGNFVYVSDHALVPDYERLANVKKPDQTPFSLVDPLEGSVAGRLATAKLEPAMRFIEAAGVAGQVEVITDDNLLTEYRHGARFGPDSLLALLPAQPLGFALGTPVIVND